MSLDSVQGLHGIVALIRSQVSAGGASAKRSATAAKRDKASVRAAQSNLEQKLVTRLASVASDDPQRRRKIFTAFIEAVLLNEFGDQLVNDAGFYQLAETVSAQMLAEPSLADTISTAVDQLLAGPR